MSVQTLCGHTGCGPHLLTLGPRAIEAQDQGEVVLLENTRFHPGEEANDPAFADALAELGEIYVNDAFSAAHRAHGSTEGIARRLPAAAGRLMAEELTALDTALGRPRRPVVAVVGGAKVSTKLELLANLVRKVDHLVIGGGMANTFLAAQGRPVGTSLCEHDLGETARDILARAGEAGCEVHLPLDLVVARAFQANAPHEVVPCDGCPEDAMILDAGPRTVEALEGVFATARTLIWNGPLGAFEIEPFDAATNAAAITCANVKHWSLLFRHADAGSVLQEQRRPKDEGHDVAHWPQTHDS